MRRSDYIGGQSAAIKHLPHLITRPSCHPTSAATTISSPSLSSPPPSPHVFSHLREQHYVAGVGLQQVHHQVRRVGIW